jgi:hypothetical protein
MFNGVRINNLFDFSLSSMDVVKGDLRINSTPEMDCNLTAIGLPPVTSAVFLKVKSFGIMWISGIYPLPLWG